MRPVLSAVLCAVLIGGCASQLVQTRVPANLVDQAHVKNMPNVRYWGDTLPNNMKAEFAAAFAQTKKQRPHLFKNGQRGQVNFLAISGGGSDGAFGAGLLKGWSAAGTRPEFDLVTGVSTGALAAPFVFLGSGYDRQLEEMYTRFGTDQLVEKNFIAGLLGGSAIADNSKLAKVIAGYVDRKLLAAVAKEHDKGRRLLIGTTNLDAERPVVWDMGRIAKGGNKKALVLFRKVLLASAAIPAVFPPVVINVTANGRTLQELHVDGGTTGQVFFLPPQVIFKSLVPKRHRKGRRKQRTRLALYIVMNTQLSAKWQATPTNVAKIAGRSLGTLMKQQAISDLYKLYIEAKNNGMDYRLASIPRSFNRKSREPFDRAYMKALFKTGYSLGKQGVSWARFPPGLSASATR